MIHYVLVRVRVLGFVKDVTRRNLARGDEGFARAPSQSSIRLVTVIGIKGD